MEENSEAHMETDVSSTTDDVPESQQVTGSHGGVETIIVVETLKEEEDSLAEQAQTTITSSATTSAEASPVKEPNPQITPQISPVKENNATQSLLKTPIKKYMSPKGNKSSPISISSKTSHVIQQPETTDSAKSETKSKESIEPTSERSLLKVSHQQLVQNKSPCKENKTLPKSHLNIQKTPEKYFEKELDPQEKLTNIIQDKSETLVDVHIPTIKEVEQPETSQNKHVQENESKGIALQVKSPTKENTIEPSHNIELIEAESSNKEVDSLNKSSKEDQLHETSTPHTCDSNSKDVSQNINIEDNETTSTVNGGETIYASAIPPNVTLEDDMLSDSLFPSELSEKDHNKSISRELKSLIKSAKDSKIISECTQLTTKTRKSRSQLEASNTSLNVSLEPEKLGAIRRASTHSQVSNSSEKSEKSPAKRSMRSQNPEFVNKCRQFLNSVTSKVMKDSDEAMSEDESITKSKEKAETGSEQDSPATSMKRKKVSVQPVLNNKKHKKIRSDAYCWRCHWIVEQGENDKSHPPLVCTVCPRSYHYKCLSANERKTPTEKNWVCPDCLQVLHAESSDTRSLAMKKTSLGMLCDLLKYALERMMDLNGVEPFMRPVDRTAFPDYDKYVVHPMDLSQMKQNIADGLYGSTDAFIADAQWILHNSIIFNTCEQAFLQSKLTGGARALVRSCRSEMGEIEACPECYASAHARKPTWFTDVCTTPHILLWAKLKGFPYWPAKGMTVNSSGLVDVRFFGAHDRAWVPAKDCFLFSEKDPNNFRTKRQDIVESMQEAEQHIRNISRKYGKFVYPPFKTQFEPSKLTEQLKLMIPSFEGEVKILPLKDKPTSASPLNAKVKRRSNSKGSKSSTYEGDVSESEEASSSARSEAVKPDKETASEKPTKVETPVVLTEVVETISTRKRRRSNMEEAVMTVIESSAPEAKKKKTDSGEQKKLEKQEPSSSKEEKANLITKAEVAESTSKKKTDTTKPKNKDDEPSSSTTAEKESLRVTPIKLVALPRPNKQTPKLFTAKKVSSKSSSPSTEEDKTPQRTKTTRSEKSSTGEKSKEDKAKSLKRRSSKGNKSLNTSSTPKTSKTAEKKMDSGSEASSKESSSKEDKKKDAKGKQSEVKLTIESTSSKDSDKPKNTKDRLQFDDDLSLAVLAQKSRHPNAGWPTISNVVSLSGTAQSDGASLTQISMPAQNIEVTVEASSDSSVFTPTSTDSVRTMKDAVSKLQKLRDETNVTEPMVGRVGVRAFARMTSPERAKNVEVEIKAEPVDLEEDADRHNEKMDLMNACKLRPVGQGTSLRDVRINRVVSAGSGPSTTGAEARPRARKTFPTPRRMENTTVGPRSELTVKNSMVYIPIQPPATQPPPRPVRPPAQRPTAPNVTGNNTVNTVVTPLKPTTSTLSSPSTSTSICNMSTAGQVVAPTVGQVPTTVHTVPLMTSVNGQWMFSLQPVMSVGGVDSVITTPMVNGLTDRNNTTTTLLSLPSTATPNSISAPTTPVQPNRTANDNSTPNELPRLQQRPSLQHPLDSTSPGGPPAPPPSAGPLTAKLHQSAKKLSDFFRTLLEESLEKTDDPVAVAATLKLQLEHTKWRHQQQIDELRHNHELTLAEMRQSFEKDKVRVVSETRRVAQIDLEAAVKLTKSKQWCANCNQEAQFYCCWNTAYCEYPCQRAHWPQHSLHCAQRNKDGDGITSPESRLQPQSDNLPALQRSAQPLGPVPALTVGGKGGATRVFTPHDAAQQKTSIIVSMVEDNSGNQTMKCVGTYKPSQAQAQMPPLILNKQVISDETGKKVVTSGGYLIVGAGGNNASVITPAPSRRPPTIQYFT